MLQVGKRAPEFDMPSTKDLKTLGQNEAWTETQTALLARLAAQVEADTSGQDAERLEVADALRRGTTPLWATSRSCARFG